MPAADPRERRTVTVLFSDLSGFTKLSEGMDPEEVQDLVDALFQRFRAAVETHGGTVDKFMGDAVMAVFGAPVAHEDDAARAVRAGLAMQEEMAAFDRERGLELRLRIGINTGEVLWGSIAGEKATVMGDAVNVAQRLESAAEPGTVLVSRAVERALRGKFLLAGRGEIRVKGREEAVEMLEVREELAGQTEHVADGPPAAFVGRETELARLLERVEGAKGVVLLEGEAGIGKSRLAAELRREFRGRHPGAWVATGRALEGMRFPLAAFGDIVRQEAGVSGLDRGDGDRIVACLVAQLPGDGATQKENAAHLIAISLGYAVPGARVRDIEPARVAVETHFAWRQWLSARAARGALLCLEDLHWADAATGELLLALATLPLAIVATARPGHSLPAAIGRLPLGDLDAAAAGRLGASVLGAPVDEALGRFLAEQSGGNPLYVEELARYLRDERLLDGAPLRLAAAPGRVPDSLGGLLVARLDALPAEHRPVLKAASVVGRAFWTKLLSQLAGCDAAPALAEARRRQLVFPQAASLLPGDDQHFFRHALIRDAAYGLVTKKERARLHAGAAALLEARIGDGGRRVKSLAARHREGAGEPAAAARLYEEAAGEALGEGAPQEGLEHAREAARLGAAKGGALTARALAGLGRFREAIAAAEPANAWAVAAWAHRGLGDFAQSLACAERAGAEGLRAKSEALLRMGRLAEARAAAGEALRQGVLPEAELARAQATAANVAIALGEWDAARAALDSALDLARRSGDRAAVAAVTNLSGNLARSRGEFAEALEKYREAIAIVTEIGDRSAAANAQSNVALTLHEIHRDAEALDAARASLALRREIGDRAGVASGLNMLGMLHRRRAEYDEALACYADALALARETGGRQEESNILMNTANVLTLRGDLAEARRTHAAAVDLNRAIGEPTTLSLALRNFGSFLRISGDFPAAAGAYEESLALSRSIGDAIGEGSTLNSIGVLANVQGRHAESEAALEASLRIRRRLDDSEGISTALQNLGLLRVKQERLDEAQSCFEESIDLRRRTRDREAVSGLLCSLGEVALKRGDAARATALLEEALALARAREEHEFASVCLLHLSGIARSRGDRAAALRLLRESLELVTRSGNRACRVPVLLGLAELEPSAARPRVEEALALARGLSLPEESPALLALARLDAAAGRREDARRGAEEAAKAAGARSDDRVAAEARDFLEKLA